MPVGVIHIAALGVGQFKLHASQRSLAYLIQLPDDQRTRFFVDKAERLALADFDLDALGTAVQNYAFGNFDLFGGDCCARFEVLDDNASIFAGNILTVVGSDN